MSKSEMDKLLALIERHLGKGYLEIADWLREQNSLPGIEERIAAGDYMGAVRNVEEAAAQFAATMHQNYVTAGRTEAEWLNDRPTLADKLIRFDEGSPLVPERARANEYKLIQGYTQEQREKTRQVLADGLARGENPRQMARSLRDGLGLTVEQQRATDNYRRSLEQGDWSRALGYELSDGRTDRTVAALQRNGGGMSQKQIDEAVDRYRTNAVNYRAEVIARTEGLRAANAGTSDAIQQAIERGDIKADQLVKTWHAGPSTEHARPDHQELDNKSVRFGEDFIVGGLPMSGPGDPRGKAQNNANCRCTSSTSIDLDA